MPMNAQQVLLAAELLGECQRLAGAVSRLNQMDDDPMANIIGQIGFSMETLSPTLTPAAARQIRAIMRADYQKSRTELMRRLGNLDVEVAMP